VRGVDVDDDLLPRHELVMVPGRGQIRGAVAGQAHLPRLVEVDSPFRHVFNPLIGYILEMKRKNPDRQIAVLIPELVARRWYHHLLHNKRAAMLKALLLVRGDDDIVVINVPWYLDA